MKRIYHNHNLWEEVKFNMYGTVDTKDKEVYINRVISFFRQPQLIEKYMSFVVETFKYSCEHNFTNPNMNKIAWLGQSAVAVWGNIPEDITRIAWRYLTIEEQTRADNIAKKYIEYWREKNAKTIF